MEPGIDRSAELPRLSFGFRLLILSLKMPLSAFAEKTKWPCQFLSSKFVLSTIAENIITMKIRIAISAISAPSDHKIYS